jgi:cell division control protein 6
MEFAFVPGVWDDKAFEIVANKASELKDIRLGLYLLKESGLIAENASSKKITVEHAVKSLGKIDDFFVKDKEQLTDNTQEILAFIKEHSGQKIGDLHKLYVQQKGEINYKSFQRNIKKLADSNFISVEKTEGGALGNTTIVKCTETKKITDF